MKPFNLDEYLKNPSKKVVTRDGKNVKIYCTNYNSSQPIVAEIEGTGTSESFAKNGKFYNDYESSKNDLFFATIKHEGWINLYKNADGISWLGPQPFMSKKEAEREGKGYTCSVTTIKIEWEE